MVLGAEVYPDIPRNRSKTVPEGNGPVPKHDEFGPDQPTLADMYRLFEERIDRQLNQMKSHFDELTDKIRDTRQRLAGLQNDAWPPLLAVEADVTSDNKTRKLTEDAAVDRVMSKDSSSAQVDHDPMCLTSFGDDFTKPPALL